MRLVQVLPLRFGDGVGDFIGQERHMPEDHAPSGPTLGLSPTCGLDGPSPSVL